MSEWIQPLEMQTWFISVFAGTPEIFTAIALIVIASLAAMFRMSGIGLFFMVGLFLLMFSAILNSSLLIIISILGGLLLGYWISRIFAQ